MEIYWGHTMASEIRMARTPQGDARPSFRRSHVVRGKPAVEEALSARGKKAFFEATSPSADRSATNDESGRRDAGRESNEGSRRKAGDADTGGDSLEQLPTLVAASLKEARLRAEALAKVKRSVERCTGFEDDLASDVASDSDASSEGWGWSDVSDADGSLSGSERYTLWRSLIRAADNLERGGRTCAAARRRAQAARLAPDRRLPPAPREEVSLYDEIARSVLGLGDSKPPLASFSSPLPTPPPQPSERERRQFFFLSPKLLHERRGAAVAQVTEKTGGGPLLEARQAAALANGVPRDIGSPLTPASLRAWVAKSVEARRVNAAARLRQSTEDRAE